MDDAIKNFPKQFAYEPKVDNEDKLKKFSKFVVVGMGGSGHAADLLKVWRPDLELVVHRNYGLPPVPEKYLEESLIIASSYSGNTEETLSGYDEAQSRGLSVSALSTGGKLLEHAKEQGVPYIKLPDTGIQPRSSLGFMFRALLKLMGEEEALEQTHNLALDADSLEGPGKELAEKLNGKVPVIYSSSRNLAIANNWKIKFNETGKIPAFYNIFPELNHNEMAGFDIKDSTKNLSSNFSFIFLRDSSDHQYIQSRMQVTKKLYEARNLPVIDIELEGSNIFTKIFSSLILADWTAYHIGTSYGVETEEVPMVEEFKELI